MAALAVMTTAGCTVVSAGPSNPTYTGTNPRSDAVLTEASRDLACPITDLRVVREIGKRLRYDSSLRFLVEGCGERGGYVEECEVVGEPAAAGWSQVDGPLACRYLLVTRVRVTQAAGP